MIGAFVFANPPRRVAAAGHKSPARRARRKKMARSIARRRGRRRILRNAKGHFVKRSRAGRSIRRRSRRRNPSGYVKVGRRWRKITKYAKRRRRGSRLGQIRGYRFPRSYRRRRRRSSGRIRHRSRSGRRHVRRHHRAYRRNPSVSYRLASDPIGAIKAAIAEAFSMDTVEALFHTGLGFGGVAAGARLIYKKVIPSFGETALGRIGTATGLTVLGTALVGMVTKNRAFTARFLAGGALATLWQVLSDVLPDSAKEFIPTLGDAETEEFRKAIEKEVLRELKGGVSDYLPAAGAEGYSTYLRPAGISYLRPAGSSAYLTSREGDRAEGMSGYLTSREVDRVEMTPSGVGEAFDEFSRTNLPEQF